MSRYRLPPGYRRLIQPAGYKVFNNYQSGSRFYAPGAPTGTFSIVYNFAAAPVNGSQVLVPDGPIGNPNSIIRTFTYTYSGFPGPGIIPLVAGGGTAAQAAAAAALAMDAQLTNWNADNVSGATLTMTQKQQGVGATISFVGNTNMTSVNGTAVSFGAVVPGMLGKLRALLPVPASAEFWNPGGGS